MARLSLTGLNKGWRDDEAVNEDEGRRAIQTDTSRAPEVLVPSSGCSRLTEDLGLYAHLAKRSTEKQKNDEQQGRQFEDHGLPMLRGAVTDLPVDGKETNHTALLISKHCQNSLLPFSGVHMTKYSPCAIEPDYSTVLYRTPESFRGVSPP